MDQQRLLNDRACVAFIRSVMDRKQNLFETKAKAEAKT